MVCMHVCVAISPWQLVFREMWYFASVWSLFMMVCRSELLFVLFSAELDGLGSSE